MLAGRNCLGYACPQMFRSRITSFPGLGPLTGTGMLAEIGDDLSGFTDARGLKAYAGAAPVTRASGVLRHRVKNQSRWIGDSAATQHGYKSILSLPEFRKTSCARCDLSTLKRPVGIITELHNLPWPAAAR